MINFEEFQEYVGNVLLEKLPENLQNATVSIKKVETNNGVILHGLRIFPEDSIIAPTIYLEGCFEMYKDGTSLNDVVERIVNCVVENIAPAGFDDIAANFHDFEYVRDKIVISVVNTAKCANLLEHMPHQDVEDLSLIYKVIVKAHDQRTASITIRNEHLLLWGVTKEKIHEIAMKNSKEVRPACVKTISQAVENILHCDDIPEGILEFMSEFPDDIREFMSELSPREDLYVISNTAGFDGASAIFYENVLQNLAEQIGTDLYILPSSVHECIAVSTDLWTPAFLSRMVKDINVSQVPPEERLSDNVYYFKAGTNEIRLAV